MKTLMISMILVLGNFAMASNNIPAKDAEGTYTCSGYKNRVYHNIEVVIETNEQETTLTWYEKEAAGANTYSRVSFKHDGDSGFYKLTLGGIQFDCSRIY